MDPANSGYSDDCFGLIFLTSSVGLNDAAFGGVFLFLSSLGVILTRLNKLPISPQIPATVAGGSLLLTPLVRFLFQNNLEAPRLAEAPWIEVGLCTFSMVYGFVVRKNED